MKTQRRDATLVSFDAALPRRPFIAQPPSNDTQQLANELLEHIFSYCTPVELTVVSSVCRRWRDVAYDCPRLWTDVEPENMSWSADFLKTVLRRSKNLPISVIMSLPQPSPDLGFSLVYLSIMAPKLHRMERLEMRLASQEDANELLYVLQGRAPMLRVLRLLSLNGQATGGELMLPRNLLAEDPGVLEDLTLAWNFSSSTPIPPAFGNVTRLQWFADRLTSATLAAIFHTCRKLVFLEVKAQDYLSELDDGPSSLLQHNLKELLIYHPLKHALLLDLGHESIPVIGLSSDRDVLNAELETLDRTDAKSLLWPVLSEHRFDALSMAWNREGNLPRLFLRFSATTSNLRRYSFINCICAMDVLCGTETLDFSSLTSATIEDGCWPEVTLFAPALRSLTIRLTHRPSDLTLLKTPSCMGDWTIFGDHSGAPSARLRLPQFPRLQTLVIENACPQSSMIAVPARRLLTFLDPQHAARRIDRLQLGHGISLQGLNYEISGLKNWFVAIVPQVQVNVLQP